MNKDKPNKDKNGTAEVPAESDLSNIDSSSKVSGFPIVGIGASAGGLAAFENFFSGMPKDSDPGMAFVLVQHLSPDHKSILTDLIQRYTSMQVHEVTDGMTVHKNCAYIIPPGHEMAFEKGNLKLLEPSAHRGQRTTIDYFFRSLADDQGERSIGIILSGTGSDGTAGIRAIKGEGGMVMAQSPESTKGYDGMPRSAIATGMVDYELPPSDMAKPLIAYVNHSFHKLPRSESTSVGNNEDSLEIIFAILRDRTNHDFTQYKPKTVMRRIERRMSVHQIHSIEDYVAYLQQTKEESKALFQDLLIGVTSFFRDADAFKALKEEVIPKLFESKGPNSEIRIWSLGCSTGEEAYSIAMLLQEHMQTLRQNHMVQIFATDLDSKAIATARAGRYPASIADDISPERLSHFFTVESNNAKKGPFTYKISKKIRDMLIFSEQNIIKDPPFSRLDLISCRNLMIYMNSDLQKKLVPRFHYALKPGGFLFLGSSETVGDFSNLFTTVVRKAKLYQRNDDALTQGMALGPISPFESSSQQEPEKKATNGNVPLRKVTEQALMRHLAPACALVNQQGDIFYLHGRTGMYLEPSTGEVNGYNIIKMAREGLQYELTAALRKTVATNGVVRCHGLSVKTNGEFTTVNLSICPAMADPSVTNSPRLYLVVLDEAYSDGYAPKNLPPSGKDKASQESNSDQTSMIESLKQDLQAKEEYIHNANEELMTSNEELKSSNEEMRSVTEEMQSTNEELETSKEELQSINEELATVNSELRTKLKDLSLLNNDMNNLISGTGIATIFVDLHLRIMRFTPGATDIINLIESDEGRPLGHVVSNLVDYDNLLTDIKEVLKTLLPKELEVRTADGKCYTMRILPYRTLDNVIEGAVVTFTDITKQNHIYEELLKSKALLFETEKNGKIGGWELDIETMTQDWTEETFHIFEIDITKGTPKVSDWLKFVSNTTSKKAKIAIKRAVEHGEFYDQEWEIITAKKNKRWVHSVGKPDPDRKKLSGSFQDITDRKLIEQEIQKQLSEKDILLKEIHHRIKNNVSSIESLLSLQAKSVTSPEGLSALQDAISRVKSMRVLYDKLLISEDFKESNVRNYVETLANSVISFFCDKENITIDTKIDDFKLNSKNLFHLGIVINELLTNVMKYAFPNKREDGKISISIEKAKQQVTMMIKDNGNGLPENFDMKTSKGFGLHLVKMLSEQMSGSYTITNNNGTENVFKFKVNE
ncbi:MAG: chemotaxis protein CheB [Balneolales bacterium]